MSCYGSLVQNDLDIKINLLEKETSIFNRLISENTIIIESFNLNDFKEKLKKIIAKILEIISDFIIKIKNIIKKIRDNIIKNASVDFDFSTLNDIEKEKEIFISIPKFKTTGWNDNKSPVDFSIRINAVSDEAIKYINTNYNKIKNNLDGINKLNNWDGKEQNIFTWRGHPQSYPYEVNDLTHSKRMSWADYDRVKIECIIEKVNIKDVRNYIRKINYDQFIKHAQENIKKVEPLYNELKKTVNDYGSAVGKISNKQIEKETEEKLRMTVDNGKSFGAAYSYSSWISTLYGDVGILTSNIFRASELILKLNNNFINEVTKYYMILAKTNEEIKSNSNK